MAKRQSVPKPTDSEFDILNIIWEQGPSTVRQVHERLSETKPSQYTTTLKLMQIMHAKGLLMRDETDRSHIYRALHKRDAIRRQFATHIMNRIFGGSVRAMLVGALSGRRASKEELAELRRILAEYEEGRR